MLRADDLTYLDGRGLDYSTYRSGNLTLLVIHNYRLPSGYSAEEIEVLIEVPDDYPDAQLNMWWVFPWITFANGQQPANANEPGSYPAYVPDPDRRWQRFSRHPPWRAGVDNLRSFMLYMDNHFLKDEEAARPA